MRTLAARLLDAILGPRCETCGDRVFSTDLEMHCWANHYGEGRAS